ncbi:MAG: hypothetical protein ACTSO9_01940 [Candidatus Helarchaeota archaeon]
MKFRKFIPIIVIGLLAFPLFIALYETSSANNLPIAIPNQISFQLSSLTSFQQEYPISPQDPNLSNPQSRIAIDSSNIVHLVYVNSSFGKNIVYATSSDDFKTGTFVTNGSGAETDPVIAIHGKKVYVAWVAENGTNTDIVLANSSTGTFTTNQTIALNGTSIDITVDSNGVVHVVYTKILSGPIYDTYYTNSSTGYSDHVLVDQNSTVITTPSITVGSDNIVHIAWNNNNSIYYANSTTNFQSNQKVSNNPDNDLTPDIISTNPVWVVWAGNVSTQKLFLANSSGNWENETISNNPYTNAMPRIAKFPSGLLNVIWLINNGTSNQLIYSNSLDNFQSNTTITSDVNWTAGDIAIDNEGRIHIIWIYNNRTWYRNSTYPSSPSLVFMRNYLIPLELTKPGTAILVQSKFFDTFMFDKVEIMWSTNTGASWNSFLMFGSSNGTLFEGISAIPGYQYGVVLLYKFRITDLTGIQHESTQQVIFYPDTRTESIVLIIVLFGVLGTLTALYLIPQTREFFGNLFNRGKSKPVESKKPKTEN